MRTTIREIIEKTNGKWLGRPEDIDQEVFAVTKDSRNVPEHSVYIPIIGDRFDGHDFVDDALGKGAIASFWDQKHPRAPKENAPIILVDDSLQALQHWAKAYRLEIGCKVVAITGSNGKTTTKDIITSTLKTKYRVHHTSGNLNNHIGVPLTLLAMPEDTDIAVIEMGMNHFGEIELLSSIAFPDISVITNIGESHIEFLGSRAGIAKAKLEILSGMRSDGVFIFHGDEPLIHEATSFQDFPGLKISCGFGDENRIRGEIVEDQGLIGVSLRVQPSGLVFSLPIPGKHNVLNALYAIAVAEQLQLTPEEIQDGLSNVKISKMRLEQITGKNEVTIINDAYNASPTSIRAAIDFFTTLTGWNHKVLVLGDIGELGSYAPKFHKEIGSLLDPKKFPHVFVTGELCAHMVEGAREQGYTQVQYVENKEELIPLLYPFLNKDTVILFKASRFMELDQIVKALS